MILTQTLASLSLALCMAGNNGQAQKAVQISKASGPMSPFERLTSGEWRMKSVGGSQFFETWRYGPGGHSVRKFTHGVNLHDNNRPWREVEVFFWNPLEKKVNLLGFSPYMASVSRGTIDLKPGKFQSRFELNQDGDVRKLGHEIAFHGKDKFQETLYESVNGQPYVVGNQWNHVWSKSVTPVPVLKSPETPKPAGAQAILAAFAGKAWQGRSPVKAAASYRTDFEWIPYANVMNIRSTLKPVKGGTISEYDLYLYQIPSEKGVQAFALFKDGSHGLGSAVAKGSGKIEVRLRMSSSENVDRSISYSIGPNGILEEDGWKIGKGSKTQTRKRVSSPVKSS
jgi:hypothetical protein